MRRRVYVVPGREGLPSPKAAGRTGTPPNFLICFYNLLTNEIKSSKILPLLEPRSHVVKSSLDREVLTRRTRRDRESEGSKALKS